MSKSTLTRFLSYKITNRSFRSLLLRFYGVERISQECCADEREKIHRRVCLTLLILVKVICDDRFQMFEGRGDRDQRLRQWPRALIMLAEIRDTVSLLPHVRHVAQVNINCRFILFRRLIYFESCNLRWILWHSNSQRGTRPSNFENKLCSTIFASLFVDTDFIDSLVVARTLI